MQQHRRYPDRFRATGIYITERSPDLNMINMLLRKSTLADVELLVQLRMDYLTEDRGQLAEDEKIAIQSQLQKYFARHLPANSFIGILAETDGCVASTAYLAISEKPANPAFITGITGTLLNVFTCPRYRRRGLATKVTERIMEEAKKAGVSSIDLSATNDGKPLYEKMGFVVSKYTPMNIKLIQPCAVVS